MKLLFALLFTLSLTTVNAQSKKEKPLKVKVDYILKNENGSSEVWVKARKQNNQLGWAFYVATFRSPIPDSIKIGKVLFLKNNIGADSCGIVFNRVK